MSKAYLLVICLLAASFTGCVGGDDDDDIIIEPILNKPLATIVSISPNPVILSALDDTGVTFVGKGDSENGYILEYDWGSSIDGFLSSEKTFTTKNLSLGNHTIFFKVLNDEHVWSEKATTVLSVVNNIDNEKSDFAENPKWDFFYVDDPNLNVIRNESRDFAIGVTNLGNVSHNFRIRTSYSSDDGGASFNTLLLVTKFLGSNGGPVAGYSDNLSCFNNVLGYCEGVEFSIGSNDVQIIIYTIEIFDEHINATVFDLYASTSWYNETGTQINETKTLSFDVTVVDAGEGGRQVEVGDSTESFYAGFLASNGRLFDSNIDYIWDNYDYFRAGVTENNRHTSSLTANNVGCIGDGDPSENCNGSKGMIEGFDAGMLGMFVGQTKYVVFPPEQGYGTNPDGHSLGGETLIFSIKIVSIEGEDVGNSPVARISPSNPKIQINETIQFSGSDSTDADGDELSFVWSFEGDSKMYEGATIERLYPNKGEYLVTLTVTDATGLSDETVTKVSVVENYYDEQSGNVDENNYDEEIVIPVDDGALILSIEYSLESASINPLEESQVTLRLTDADGEVVQEENGVSESDGTWSYDSDDLSLWSTGDYTFTIENESGSMDFDIIIYVGY